jgi:DNA invertase Pin-like site-specific DNA recombinase
MLEAATGRRQAHRWQLDRLGRSVRDLITMVTISSSAESSSRSLTEAIDGDRPTGRSIWQMIGVRAEWSAALSASGHAPVSRPQKREA